MLADDHAGIHFFVGADHHYAALFKVEQGIARRLAAFQRDQNTDTAGRDRSLVRRVGMEQSVHHPGAARLGHEVAVITDQAPRRAKKAQTLLAAAGRAHFLQFTLADRHRLDDRAGVFLVNVDDHFLDRLHPLTTDRIVAVQHPRTADRHLEALAAHLLDQHRELKFAAAGNLEGIPSGGLFNADRDIALGFPHQAIPQHPRGDLIALTSGDRAVVDREGNGDGRWIDRCGFDGLAHRDVGDGIGDGRSGQPGQGDDIAGAGMVQGHPLQTTERQDLGDPRLFQHLAVAGHRLDRHVRPHFAGFDPTGKDPSEIGVRLQGGYQHPERLIQNDLWGRDMRHDAFEQRRHVLTGRVRRFRGPAHLGRGEQGRKIKLLVIGVQRGEEIEHFVLHFIGALVGLIDLVDHDDRAQPKLQGFGQHELGLRHRAFRGIDQHQHPINHRQDAFDLTAEIGMAGGIDDVDPGIVPGHRGAFGQDGDAALTLEIVGVHRALLNSLIVTEGSGLAKQNVDQGRLTVVDMSDNGDVAQVHGAAA